MDDEESHRHGQLAWEKTWTRFLLNSKLEVHTTNSVAMRYSTVLWVKSTILVCELKAFSSINRSTSGLTVITGGLTWLGLSIIEGDIKGDVFHTHRVQLERKNLKKNSIRHTVAPQPNLIYSGASSPVEVGVQSFLRGRIVKI